MIKPHKKRVKSTPFSEFFRNAKSAEKRQFFDKIAREAIKEQQAMIALAEKTHRFQK
jgi:type III secretory pathway component EscR